MADTPQRRPRIVIAGGGYAGVRAARRLAHHYNADITLISSDDSFAYYPQLYHSATGGARAESWLPLTDLLDGTHIQVVRDTVTTLDPVAKTIAGSSGTSYPYDELLIALGSVTNYFGIQGLPEFSYDIKTITGAERFKHHLHDQLAGPGQELNYVIIGGGPTGVELAGALPTYLHRITRLHGQDKPQYKIDLIEAAPRLLPRSSEATSARVTRHLQKLGVNVMTGATVKGETADTLQLEGQDITTKTVVWTAGVANNSFFKANEAHFKFAPKGGKVEVDEHLQGAPNVYVLGDNAATPYSGMAQTAIYDADFVAHNLMKSAAGHPLEPYHPRRPISVVPAGEGWAALEWGNFRLFGLPAWVLRRAADLIAYSDIESWPKALGVWSLDTRREDLCGTCEGKA